MKHDIPSIIIRNCEFKEPYYKTFFKIAKKHDYKKLEKFILKLQIDSLDYLLNNYIYDFLIDMLKDAKLLLKCGCMEKIIE